jgi:hypothetical protein
VLDETGIATASYRTVTRRLPVYAKESRRQEAVSTTRQVFREFELSRRSVAAHLVLGPDLGHPAVQGQAQDDLRRPLDLGWWQVLGSNQRRLSRRFYRPGTNMP